MKLPPFHLWSPNLVHAYYLGCKATADLPCPYKEGSTEEYIWKRIAKHKEGEVMSDKLKSMDYQLMTDRVQELMTKGKESKRAGWAMSEIVEKIGIEFGQDYEESCRQYIKEYILYSR